MLDEATTKKVKQSAADFIQEIDRMKVSQEVDRAKISAAYMQHASKLIGGELGAKLDNALKGMVAAVQSVRNPPPPPVAPPSACTQHVCGGRSLHEAARHYCGGGNTRSSSR